MKLSKKFAILASVVLACVIWRPALAIVTNAITDYVQIGAPSNPGSGLARVYVNSSTQLLACLLPGGGSCMPSGGGGSFIQPLTAPIAANFTQFNYNTGSGVTTTQTNNSSPVTSISIIQQDPGNTQNMVALGKAKLAATFTVTIGFATASLSGDGFAGLWLYDGTSNIILAGYQNGGGAGRRISLFSNFSTYTGDLYGPEAYYFQPISPIVYYRVQETASARNYSVSADGINYIQALTESNTAHFTTADYGFAIEPRTGGIGTLQGVLYSFSETNP